MSAAPVAVATALVECQFKAITQFGDAEFWSAFGIMVLIIASVFMLVWWIEQ